MQFVAVNGSEEHSTQIMASSSPLSSCPRHSPSTFDIGTAAKSKNAGARLRGEISSVFAIVQIMYFKTTK